MQLSTLAHKIGGTLLGSDGEFARVSTDTRTLQAGDLFVALQGEHFDGHEYVATAKAGGAVAAIVYYCPTRLYIRLDGALDL